jgi:hypothetical protein
LYWWSIGFSLICGRGKVEVEVEEDTETEEMGDEELRRRFIDTSERRRSESFERANDKTRAPERARKEERREETRKTINGRKLGQELPFPCFRAGTPLGFCGKRGFLLYFVFALLFFFVVEGLKWS